MTLPVFAASISLVLQLVLSAWAMAGTAGQPQLDAFGNPLCVTHADGGPPAPYGDRHGTVPACCTIGCAAFASALPASDPAIASLRFPAARAAGFPPRAANSGQSRPDHDRGNPRAPPLMA